MFCVKCGQQLGDNMKFCTRCGHPVAPVPTPASPTQAVQTPPQQQAVQTPPQQQPACQQIPVGQPNQQPPNKKSKVLVVILAVVLGLLLFAVVLLAGINFWMANKPDAEDTSAVSSTYDQKEENESEETVEAPEEETQAEPEVADEETVELLDANTKEGQLQRGILEMNEASYEKQMIDVYKINHSVGQRDTSYAWKDIVFYTLEGYRDQGDYYNKNQCVLVKKELINKATGNVMDYEIYLNPHDNVANKIVSIEYLADGIEVTEYYYTKSKKPNFVFQYQTDNYVSSYATPDKKGQRFLFHQDCLVTWRKVSGDGTKNYSVGQNEINRLKAQWPANTLFAYSSLDTDTKTKFDKYEKKMLNAAYNTYETVMNAEGISMIQGYVYDQSSSGLSDATVELYDTGFENKLFSTKTMSDGTYRIYVPFEEYRYNVRVIMDGFEDCNIYNVEINNEQIGVYQDSIYLFENGGADTSVSMTLGDAFNYNSSGTGMMLLSSANVNIRKGINNRTGSEIVYSGTTDSNGYIQVTLRPGVYTLEVIASGYETMYYTIIANPILSNIYEFYAAPKLNDGEYAIVLTWGEHPNDLDSHLFTTRGTSSAHVWYGGMSDQFGNSLDVDDTSSYGPETMTIDALTASDYYKYCIVDFTNCSGGDLGSYEMSHSQATVNVYSSDGLLGTFHVPTNTPGVIWEVFEIRGGRLTPIQRYYDNVTNKDWWHQDK